MITVRPATLPDIPDVRFLLVSTWHDTYDAILGAARVTAITDSWHSLANLSRQVNWPKSSFLVAELGKRIVGTASCAEQGGILQINRLYVLPKAQGMGAGSALLDEMLKRHPGLPLARLFVQEANERAVDFYRRRGFAVVGETLEDGLKVLRMERPLSPA